MIISTYQQFYNLIKDDLSAIAHPLGDCIQAINKICACKKDAKQSKSNSCNDLYITFIKNSGDGLKEYFVTKTTDDVIIFNHSTHHPISRLLLR